MNYDLEVPYEITERPEWIAFCCSIWPQPKTPEEAERIRQEKEAFVAKLLEATGQSIDEDNPPVESMVGKPIVKIPHGASK